jgi:hypothetical protein
MRAARSTPRATVHGPTTCPHLGKQTCPGTVIPQPRKGRPNPSPWRQPWVPGRKGLQAPEGRSETWARPNIVCPPTRPVLIAPPGLRMRVKPSPMAHAMGYGSFGPPGLRSGGRPACRRGGRPAPRNPPGFMAMVPASPSDTRGAPSPSPSGRRPV